jgi:hypothetical protein
VAEFVDVGRGDVYGQFEGFAHEYF